MAASRGQNEQDREQALHELADEFGEGVGNAEELINANARRRTADLATISSLPVLQEPTDTLDLDKLDGPDGEYVVDAAVHGAGATRGTIVIYEDETGRLHKHLSDSNIGDRTARRQDGPRRSSHAKETGEDAKASDAAKSKQ